MISSELPEILGMSDRIMVINSGKLAGFIEAKGATQKRCYSMQQASFSNRRMSSMNLNNIGILSKDGRASFFEKYGTVLILLGMIVIIVILNKSF
jgi:hypothetical protein